MENQKFTPDTQSKILPTVDELRQALAASEHSDTRDLLRSLFDEATFVELGTYAKRSFSEFAASGKTDDFEGVICGYGAIDGRLVYAFGQDLSRMNGAMDEGHAKKICSLYDMALKNGAPMVGIFNSTGADIYEGVSSLAAYGRIMRSVAQASGMIPQIALLAGDCTGISAPLSAMFDFTVAVKGSALYVRSPELEEGNEANNATVAFWAEDKQDAIDDVRRLLSYLPANAEEGIYPTDTTDSLNRLLGKPDFGGDLHRVIALVADNGVFLEIGVDNQPTFLTAFTTIGGVRCAVCGNTRLGVGSMLNAEEARKAARFVSFCDAFSIPLVTFVDTAGFAFCKTENGIPYTSALASLASAYASSTMPKISIILGQAIGGAYTLLGSKSVGADIAYALDVAEIGALTTEAAVAFAWNDRITLDTTREDLENEWRKSLASPVAAACRGEIDDIIGLTEMRQRICSSLFMLAAKGTAKSKRHSVLP